MATLLALMTALGLPTIARLMRSQPPRRTALILTAVAGLCLLVNGALTAFTLAGVVMRSPLVGMNGIGGSLLIDVVSGPILALIALIGLIVIAYSRNYLAGDPGQSRFLIAMADTIAAALLFVMSGNLALSIVLLIIVSLSLHRLLTFYPDRPAAQRAAAKKFVVSRLADIALIIAATLLYRAFGTLEIADLMTSAKSSPENWSATGVTTALVMVTFAALIKSAQFPLHGWLLEVMETPTPVSALLHAGIVNAGGFLAIRLANGLLTSPVALDVLMTVGAVTALLASLIMATQTTVKGQLAYSTIAQMGFMLMQCGFGAFASALLHILAHSLYKAHAFLSAGSVMATRNVNKPANLSLMATGIVLAGLVTLAGTLAVITPIDATSLLFATLFLAGILPLVVRQAMSAGYWQATISFTALTLAYAVTQIGVHWLMAGTLPAQPLLTTNLYARILGYGVLIAFTGISIAQMQDWNASKHPAARALSVHLRNGLYLNTFANRLALAVWPHKTATSA